MSCGYYDKILTSLLTCNSGEDIVQHSALIMLQDYYNQAMMFKARPDVPLYGLGIQAHMHSSIDVSVVKVYGSKYYTL